MSFKIRQSIFFLLPSIILLVGCKKFVEVPPPDNQLTSEVTFSNDETAESAVNGIYAEMNNNSSQFSDGFTTLYAGLAADELYYYSPGLQNEFYTNQITILSHQNLTNWFWLPAYKYIYTCNNAIEKLETASNLTPSTQKRLKAECEFLRAFCYFHLTNLFGDVPLTTSSLYTFNKDLPRTNKLEVYNQIIKDLTDAESALDENYQGAERTRVNKFAASALLAKVYLYTQDWGNAEKYSTKVIGSSIYSLEDSLKRVFLKNSTEAILQLSSVTTSVNTWEGNAILPASAQARPTYLIRPELLNDFDSGDLRKTNWIARRPYAGDTVYYPYKYKVYGKFAPQTESYMLLRLADQYLIRAEARAQLNNIDGALEDLNKIRHRAAIDSFLSTNQEELLKSIMHERRIEMFAEWGNRWFDLARTGKADQILGPLKPQTWQPTDILWPIPQDQIDKNPALKQNAGY